MGRKHRAAVMSYWAPVLGRFRGGRPLLLAYAIADAVPDGDDRWWAGHVHAAELMGLHPPGEPLSETSRQAMKRTVRRLVAEGFLEVVEPPRPGANTVYRVHWKEPPLWPSRPL